MNNRDRQLGDLKHLVPGIVELAPSQLYQVPLQHVDNSSYIEITLPPNWPDHAPPSIQVYVLYYIYTIAI